MTGYLGISTVDDFVEYVWAKQLTARDIPAGAGARRELQGVSGLRGALTAADEDQSLASTWTGFSRAGTITSRGAHTVRWYDARRNSADRAPEFRLYYPKDVDMSRAQVGDLLVVLKWRAPLPCGAFFGFYIIPRGAELGVQVCTLLRADVDSRGNLAGSSFVRAAETGELRVALHGSVRALLTALEPSFARRAAARAIEQLPAEARSRLSESDVGRFIRHVLTGRGFKLDLQTLALCDMWGEHIAHWCMESEAARIRNVPAAADDMFLALLNTYRARLSEIRRSCFHAALSTLFARRGLRIDRVESPSSGIRRYVLRDESPKIGVVAKLKTVGVIDDYDGPFQLSEVRALQRRTKSIIVVADQLSKRDRGLLESGGKLLIIDGYPAIS